MDAQGKKLVSIGFPTYQGDGRISHALDLLLAQTYDHFELIISDNASSDDTSRIAQEYAMRDSRIRFFRQKENIGRINNFRFVLENAHGDYFLWAGDDDEWGPKFLETLAAGLDTHPGHGVALCSFQRFISDGSVAQTVSFAGSQNLTDMPYREVLKKIMANEPIHIFISGLWRRDMIRKILERSIPETLAWDRIIMAEAALMTHFYSADQMLFRKYLNRVSIKSRYGKDPEQNRHFVLFAYDRFLFALIGRLMASRLIPLRRKFLAPFPWFGLVWAQRKRIIGVTICDLRRWRKRSSAEKEQKIVS